MRSNGQGWQYGTVRAEFAYYVPRTLNRTVLTSRTRTITKKAYRTSVPYFLAKIEAYRTVPTYRTVLPSKDGSTVRYVQNLRTTYLAP